MQKLESSMKQVETLRVELAAYFCEDESTFLLDDAFTVIRTFCDKLNRAIKVSNNHTYTNTASSARRFTVCRHYYIHQVNGVKLEDILFYLRFRPSVRTHI